MLTARLNDRGKINAQYFGYTRLTFFKGYTEAIIAKPLASNGISLLSPAKC